jgi:NTE family protein
LVIPTFVVAVDLATGAPVILREGNLRRNVLASAAIPGVFPPVTIGDRILVDGGVVAQVPLLQAQELGARTLVVFDAGFP